MRIFSNYITMEFRLDKCATLNMQKGSVVNVEGINLPNNHIRGLHLEKATNYKYLGIFQADETSNMSRSKRRLQLNIPSEF
jgi:hypothetical protein